MLRWQATYSQSAFSNFATHVMMMIIIIILLLFSYLQCIGLQERSVPPTWVIGSNFHVQMVGGVARRLPPGHSPYAVLGSELTPLPFINVEGLKFQTAIIIPLLSLLLS